MAAASLWSSLGWLPRLTQETLVITGTADALVPAANASILASKYLEPRFTVSMEAGTCAC